MKTLETGDNVPEFSLLDQYGHLFNISDHLQHQKLVIYFYPKDESAVCTAEACAFRDSFTDFIESGALVVGINEGSVDSHRKFAEKNRLPFLLLSDPDNKVRAAFGVKPWLFLKGRETFVTGTDGTIAFKFRAFLNGEAHPQKVLQFLNEEPVSA
ncbi:peroxiredoxin [Mucilaginibacter celer]|uniref:thioredoxin-dependent peroxiredoxin n=1 Tax=Mucilaginibacter celer TaxID=2305508 RepID=A0A494VSI4_9SPHI|nr:peroxiredoxin [Mucilaginibacter celer]AYL94313.1 peroxiredoxin [Mucilaginibacter celer]